MWCHYFQIDRDCSGVCTACPYGYKVFPDYYSQSFNYECPDCHGRFNFSAIPSVTSSLVYKCPFCGKEMKGLI